MPRRPRLHRCDDCDAWHRQKNAFSCMRFAQAARKRRVDKDLHRDGDPYMQIVVKVLPSNDTLLVAGKLLCKTVLALKRVLQEHYGPDVDKQMLVYHNWRLEDHCTLGSYGIGNLSVVHLVLPAGTDDPVAYARRRAAERGVPLQQVRIRTPDRKETTLEGMLRTHSVKTLREHIHAIDNRWVPRLTRLLLDGKELRDDSTLESTGVLQGSVVQVEFKS